jgi:pimeloyl-ACP methyl ester carboxylesterase
MGFVSSHRPIRKYALVLIAVIFALIIASPSIRSLGYFDITKVVYGQPASDRTNSNTTNSLNLQDIPLEKVHVGDIDMAYKMLGKGEPIVLLPGGSAGMNAWDPSFIKDLSSNHTVIVFDPRGVGNTTIGSNPYTMQQLANDTAGLLDALNIQNANVLGYSLGSYVAQQLALTNPEKVSRLILAGSSCGGKESMPKPSEFLNLQDELVNKISNNVTISREENIELLNATLGAGWIRLHPESLENVTEGKGFFASISPEAQEGQNNIGHSWEATNWDGVCEELTKLAKPTLIITGTDDNYYQPHENSLILAEKIPGAWLVQIENASHAVMDQYPEEVGKIMNTFLSTVPNN